ncbi:MAG: DsrE family protein [Porticoccaceae bacterium]
MKTMAIIVRDDGYDKILTPLAFAYFAASEGVQVDMLFVNWAVLALTEDGARALKIDGAHADQDALVRERVAAAGLPNDINTLLKALKETGNVNFYACSLAATLFGVDENNIIPEATGITGAAWFINDKADKADHCQYF